MRCPSEFDTGGLLEGLVGGSGGLLEVGLTHVTAKATHWLEGLTGRGTQLA